jgi:histidine triad (HIT) family protein
MYNHQPKDYVCPLCIFVKGEETKYNKRSDILFEDDKTMAFVSPQWWKNNVGHIIVIPKKHTENLYETPDDIVAHVHIQAKKAAIALKETYHCDGITIIQHNEPSGNQDVWHYHVHVFPRYEDDTFYKNFDHRKYVEENERKPYADKLKNYLYV